MIAIYARAGTLNDNSLFVQRKKGIEFAESIGDKYVVYEEMASGNSIDSRNQLKRLLEDVQKGGVTKVWVIDLTRLSRKTEDLHTIRQILHDNNVELYINIESRPYKS